MSLSKPPMIYDLQSPLFQHELQLYNAFYAQKLNQPLAFNYKIDPQQNLPAGFRTKTLYLNKKNSKYTVTTLSRMIEFLSLYSYGFNFLIKTINPEILNIDLANGKEVTCNLLKKFKCCTDFYKIAMNIQNFDLLDLQQQAELDVHMQILPHDEYVTWLFLRIFPLFNMFLFNIKNFNQLEKALVLAFDDTKNTVANLEDYYKNHYWIFYDKKIKEYFEDLQIFYINEFDGRSLDKKKFKNFFVIYKIADKLKIPKDVWNLFVYHDLIEFPPLLEKKRKSISENSEILNYILKILF